MQARAQQQLSDWLENVGSEIDPPTLTQPTLAFLKAYWEGKRRGELLPARGDIDPCDMKDHLGWISLADVLPEMADFRFRLIGTRVTEYFLRDSTGRTVGECFARLGPGAIKGSLACFRKVARDRVPLRLFGSAGWIGKDFLEFDTLLLPLAKDGRRVDMILGAFTFDAKSQALRRPLSFF